MRGAVDLGRKLRLEEVVRQPDNAGGYTENWVLVGTLWADMRAGTGRERVAGAATLSSMPYHIIVRAAPVAAPSRPKAGQRFRAGTRIFTISAVAEYGLAGLFLECFTREEVAS